MSRSSLPFWYSGYVTEALGSETELIFAKVGASYQSKRPTAIKYLAVALRILVSYAHSSHNGAAHRARRTRVAVKCIHRSRSLSSPNSAGNVLWFYSICKVNVFILKSILNLSPFSP